MHCQISRNLLARQLILESNEQHRKQHSKKSVLIQLNPRTVEQPFQANKLHCFCSLKVKKKSLAVFCMIQFKLFKLLCPWISWKAKWLQWNRISPQKHIQRDALNAYYLFFIAKLAWERYKSKPKLISVCSPFKCIRFILD